MVTAHGRRCDQDFGRLPNGGVRSGHHTTLTQSGSEPTEPRHHDEARTRDHEDDTDRDDGRPGDADGRPSHLAAHIDGLSALIGRHSDRRYTGQHGQAHDRGES
jgi:hypothetical protein